VVRERLRGEEEFIRRRSGASRGKIRGETNGGNSLQRKLRDMSCRCRCHRNQVTARRAADGELHPVRNARAGLESPDA